MYYIWYIADIVVPRKSIVAQFYREASGREPVRDWLGKLYREDRKLIGRDLMTVEFGWPCGPPLCAPITGYPGLYEVRSNLTSRRIARVFFTISGSTMLLLHGFIKKTQKTPLRDLRLAERRMKEYSHGR